MTVSPWLVLAGALLGAGLGAALLALHPTAPRRRAMTAWTVLATCGPAALISIWWLHRITHHPTSAHVHIYVPPPITDHYVNQQIAQLEQQWERQR